MNSVLSAHTSAPRAKLGEYDTTQRVFDWAAGEMLTPYSPPFSDENLTPPFFMDETKPTPESLNALHIDPRLHRDNMYAASLEGTPSEWGMLDWTHDKHDSMMAMATPADSVNGWDDGSSTPSSNIKTPLNTSTPTFPSVADSSASNNGADSSREHDIAKRRAHYRIEKRYRENINDKIKALDLMLPKVSPSDRQYSDEEEEEENFPAGAVPIRRSKGEVLSRAIDYIEFLKGKSQWQDKKLRDLKNRIKASRKALEI